MILKTIVLIGFLFVGNVFSATVDCSNGDCSYDSLVEVSNISSSTEYTNIWVNNIIDDTFSLIVPLNEIPRNAFIYLNNGVKNKTLNISSGSTVIGYDGPDFKIVTDIFSSINISGSGISGVNGKNSTNICAERFSSGYYGQTALDYWNQRDTGKSNLSCDNDDVDWVNDQFSCPSGYNLGGNTVNLSRLVTKRKCSAGFNQAICLKRTYDVTCNMNIVRRKCGNEVYSLADHSDYYNPKSASVIFNSAKCTGEGFFKKSGDILERRFRISEKTRLQYPSNEDLCNYLISNQTGFNASWDYTWNDNGVWRTEEVFEKEVSYEDGVVKRQFYFPLPDNITDSEGNTILPDDIRVGLKAWGTGNFSTITSSAVTMGKRMIHNCLGLDGSAPNDFLCDRTPGEAFDITFNIIDSKGNKSRDLVVKIPEGRWDRYLVWYSSCGLDADEGTSTLIIRGSTFTQGTSFNCGWGRMTYIISFAARDSGARSSYCGWEYNPGPGGYVVCDPNNGPGHWYLLAEFKDYY